jgi:hypothetical protein
VVSWFRDAAPRLRHRHVDGDAGENKSGADTRGPVLHQFILIPIYHRSNL